MNVYPMEKATNKTGSSLKDVSISLTLGDIARLKVLTKFDYYYDKEHGFDVDAYLTELDKNGIPQEVFYALVASAGSNCRVKFAMQPQRMLNMLILSISPETLNYLVELIRKCPLNDLNLPSPDSDKFTPLHQALYCMAALAKTPEVNVVYYNLYKHLVELLLKRGANPFIQDAYKIKADEIEVFQWHKNDFEKCIREYQEKSFVAWRSSYYFGEEQPCENIVKQKHKEYEQSKTLAEFYTLQAIAKKNHEVIDLTIVTVND